MGWHRGVKWHHDSVDDDPWWRSGDPWQHPLQASKPKQESDEHAAVASISQPQQREHIARVLDPTALSPCAQACYAAMLGLAHGSASRQVVAGACAAMIRTVKSDECDTEVCNMLHAQEQLLAIVELELGPGHGIGDVRRILKNNGYSNLASQASQIHGKRRSAAHPASLVLERLRAALRKCKTCDVNGDDSMSQEQLEQDGAAECAEAEIGDSRAVNPGKLNSLFGGALKRQSDQLLDLADQGAQAIRESYKSEMDRSQKQWDQKFAQLEKVAAEALAAQQCKVEGKTKHVQFSETVDIQSETRDGDQERNSDGDPFTSEDEFLANDEDYLEFLRSGGERLQDREDIDLEGFS